MVLQKHKIEDESNIGFSDYYTIIIILEYFLKL